MNARCQDEPGNTGLTMAVSQVKPNIDIVKALLQDYRVDVNLRNALGDTPLMALALGTKKTFKANIFVMQALQLLLSHMFIEKNQQDALGRSALIRAIDGENVEVAKVLCLQSDIDVNIKTTNTSSVIDLSGNSQRDSCALFYALGKAAGFRGESILHALLILPTLDVNSRIYNNLTPVHWAAVGKTELPLRLLLKRCEIEVNATSRTEETALMQAAYNGCHRQVYILLRDDRTDPTIRDHKGYCALDYAVHGFRETGEEESTEYRNIIQFLLTHRNTPRTNLQEITTACRLYSEELRAIKILRRTKFIALIKLKIKMHRHRTRIAQVVYKPGGAEYFSAQAHFHEATAALSTPSASTTTAPGALLMEP